MLPPKVFGPGSDRSLQIALAFLCVAYGMANSLTKLSLQFVSVPTQIVFKSCKLVAVMLGSTVILKKSYTVAEYLIALGLVAGMVSFALADMRVTAMSSLKEAGVWCDAKQRSRQHQQRRREHRDRENPSSARHRKSRGST